MLFCCSSNLSHSTSQTQASIVLFCFLCVCVCVCAVGVRGGWPSLRLPKTVLLTFPSEMLSYLRPADRMLTAKRSNIEQMSRLRSQTDLCLLAEWQVVCVNFVSCGSDEMALTRVALFFFACKDWSDLMRTRHALSYAWCEHRVAAQDCWHCYNHWGEGSGLCVTNSRHNATPSTSFHPHLFHSGCRRSPGNHSRERGNRFQERLPNERTWLELILVSDWSQSTAQSWLRKCRRELRHVLSSRKHFDDQNQCCVHRFKVFAARTFTFSHFGAFNVTALPW